MTILIKKDGYCTIDGDIVHISMTTLGATAYMEYTTYSNDSVEQLPVDVVSVVTDVKDVTFVSTDGRSKVVYTIKKFKDELPLV